MSSARSLPGWLCPWLPVLFRVVAVTVTVYPAVRKFVEYSPRVERFAAYGMPWPEATVPLTGVVELVAIESIGAGLAGRLGAGMLVVGMLVALVAAGPNPAILLVLVSSVGVALLGTGPYSYWDPTLPELLGRADGAGVLPREDRR